MKSARQCISVEQYRALYDKPGCVDQLVREVLNLVPTADYIEITAVDLDQEAQEAALTNSESLPSGVRGSELPVQEVPEERAA